VRIRWDAPLLRWAARHQCGGASLERAAALAVFCQRSSGALSGRLISAVIDDFPTLPTQIPAHHGFLMP